MPLVNTKPAIEAIREVVAATENAMQKDTKGAYSRQRKAVKVLLRWLTDNAPDSELDYILTGEPYNFLTKDKEE